MSLMDVFVKIGADTSDLESGISNAKGLASGLGNGLKTAMSVGAAAIGAATTAVGAFAAASIETGKTFDSSMSQVAATMGVSKDEIKDLEDFAKDMGAKTAFSATQAADALNYMALAGYDAETSMDMLPNVLNLAAAGGIDLALASDMVTDAQTALGLSLSETTELVDMMAKTSSKSNTSVQQLGDAILTIGGTAKNLAGGTNELNTMLGVLADNGIKGAEAGTHLRNAILSLSAPTDDAASMLESLGVETVDAVGNLRPMEDIMQDLSAALDGLGTADKAEIISTIFNKTDIAAVNAMLDTSAERYDELSLAIDGAWMSEKSFADELRGAGLENAQSKLEALGITEEQFAEAAQRSKGSAQDFVNALADISGTNAQVVLSTMQTNLSDLQRTFDSVSGSAEQMAQTQLDNLAGDITLWNSAMEGAQLLISGALAPSLREFVQFGTDGLTQISDAFKEGGLSGAMDAFGAVLSDGIGMITSKIPTAINAGMQLLGAVGQGILDNLPQIVDASVEIVTQLAAGLVEALPQLAEGVVTLIESLGESFAENSDSLMQVGADLLTMLWDGVTEGLPMLVEGITSLMGELGTYLQEAIPQLLPAALNAILQFSASLRENAGLLVDGALGLITSLANGLIQSLPALIQTIPTIVSNIAGIINDNAPKLIETGFQLLGQLLSGIVEAIPTLIAEFPKIVQAIFDVILAVNWLDLGGSIITGIGEGIAALATNIPQALLDIATQALQWFADVQWLELGKDVIDFIVEGIDFLVNDIPTALEGIAKDALQKVKDIDWLDLGKNIVDGIANGVKGAADTIITAISDMCKSAWDSVKSFFGIASPSKLMKWAGKMVDEGFAAGITKNLDLVDDAMDEFTDRTTYDPTSFVGSTDGLEPAYAAAGYTQTVNVYAPTELDPSEVARQTRNATRDMVLELRGRK